MRIVAIGDFHIPDRAKVIPSWIIDIMNEAGPDMIFCTGDITNQETLDYLNSFAPVFAVEGNMDYLDLPHHIEKRIGKWKIGMMHGTEIVPRGDIPQLYMYAKKMNANILIHGHTHVSDISIYNDTLFVNPGSACGVWGGGNADMKQSFCIMDFSDEVLIRLYVEGEEKRFRYGN